MEGVEFAVNFNINDMKSISEGTPLISFGGCTISLLVGGGAHPLAVKPTLTYCAKIKGAEW